MKKISIGLIGYGNVGQGVVKLLSRHKKTIKEKYKVDLLLRAVCDRSLHKKNTRSLKGVSRTKNYRELLKDKRLDCIIELIGGMHPAQEIVLGALKNGKHVITANKELIANEGQSLFRAAQSHRRHIYFESSVGAGIPIIKTITEGVAGNRVNGLYGIINGTCNFILSEMTKEHCSFSQALKDAQKKGFAESNPTLDINGMDSAHKLAILVYLAFGKSIAVKDIHVEGITHISRADIEYADSLDLTIKLLAIAKRVKDKIEVRVHPTLISKEHPLASINGIYNALFLDLDPLGDVILSGEGAGQMAAASGVLSDLINLATRPKGKEPLLANLKKAPQKVRLHKIDQIRTKFYIRFMVTDKPGVLSLISGILGRHGISIASVSQKADKSRIVPVVMLTDYAHEKKLRLALSKISQLKAVKSKPVAIRMEKLS